MQFKRVLESMHPRRRQTRGISGTGPEIARHVEESVYMRRVVDRKKSQWAAIVIRKKKTSRLEIGNREGFDLATNAMYPFIGARSLLQERIRLRSGQC